MREILFRGQTRKNGEKVNMRDDKLPGKWVYGGVLQGQGDYSIIYGSDNPDNSDVTKHTVYTDTLGQYTGLTDKTGKRIFEGDVLAVDAGDGIIQMYTIRLQSGIWMVADGDDWDFLCTNRYGLVIGNIHDNPELLEDG